VFSHSGCLNENIKVDVVAAQVVVLKVRKHSGLLGFQSDLKGSESLWRHNPWRDSAGKILGVEGSKRDVLPLLHVSSTPVIEEDESEDMVSSLVNGDGITLDVCLSDERAHLELKIQKVASGPFGYLLGSRDLNLSLRSTDGSA